MFAGRQVNRWINYDSTGTTACTCHAHCHLSPSARSQQTQRFTQNQPRMFIDLCVHEPRAVHAFLYTRHKDVIVAIFVLWVLCVRSNCNFASGGYGIAARQTDGMSYINIFMLEALPMSRMRTLRWCKVLLTLKPVLWSAPCLSSRCLN